MSLRSFSWWLLALLALAQSQAVLAGDGAAALQTADPSCADDSTKRFVDCGNGTVTDNDTGLVWLQFASCFGSMDWDEATRVVAGLGDNPDCVPFGSPGNDGCDCYLNDGSSPGEWRLPTVSELKQLISHGEVMGCSPTMTNDDETACWSIGCPQCSFWSVQPLWYWSSSPAVHTDGRAWTVYLADGDVIHNLNIAAGYLWPVRGGQ